MKPSITIDFLRGVLSTFVAYRCYVFCNALWIGFFPHFQPYQAGNAALLLALHALLLIGLLFRPDRSAKTVFIFLALLCLLPLITALYWFNHPLPELSRSPFTAHFIASLGVSVVAAGIAYVHYRARQRHQLA